MIKTEMNPQRSLPYIARLRWLMRLRWLALLGVSGGSTIAVLGLVPGINRPVVTLAITLGVASNAYIQWKISRRDTVDLEGLHVHQALLDTVVLSLVLWACGPINAGGSGATIAAGATGCAALV